MLSKQAINLAISRGKVTITPFDEQDIEAAHINLHIEDMAGGELVVKPKSFLTSQTLEKITLAEDLCGLMEGRGALARQGLSVEQSSTFIEPGTDNALILEIFNASDQPITLKGGQEIAKLLILKVVDSI